MNDTIKKISISTIWLTVIIAFPRLSLEEFLLRASDYNIYQVLNINLPDLFLLTIIVAAHYLLLRKAIREMDVLMDLARSSQYRNLIPVMVALASFGLYALIPSQFPPWIYWVLLGSHVVFYIIVRRFATHPILKLAFLLLFGAGLNGSLIFWMHEESNKGRHLEYARQLADKRDVVAESALKEIVEQGGTVPQGADRFEFWERLYLSNDYLSSNYRIEIKEGVDTTTSFNKPILISDSDVPTYKVNLAEGYSILASPDVNMRKSVYAPGIPYKNLKDIDKFHFSVIDGARVVLSNSQIFNPYIFDFKLPGIGQGEKIELRSFDVLAYRHSDEVFVLIGEPLSEVQVWISNFAFLFTLFSGASIFLGIIRILFSRRRLLGYWQDSPIQFRIQFVLLGMTFTLFFIISATTFLFLDQSDTAISKERMLSVSKTVRNEIVRETKELDLELGDLTVPFLRGLADRQMCDVDLYDLNGRLMVGSFATASNSSLPEMAEKRMIDEIRRNNSLIKVNNQYAEVSNKPYLRTYFGIFEDDILKGIGSVSSFESEIGTSFHIAVIMDKLLNVYVFLLLTAMIGGILLIGILTKPLELLAGRLGRFRLGKENEKLNWKGDDAIGRLIDEYNKMVDKVEVTTQELMRIEREGAWQVMAQQIAHEINNKLTPLKLNVQFLSRIVDRLDTTASGTTHRITNEIVEKVDGIHRIALQFQMFAQLDSPEMGPIRLERFLKEYLQEYRKKERWQYTFSADLEEGQHPIINIDKGHLQEVLNNLLSHSEESIPDERDGLITIKLGMRGDNAIIEVADNGNGIEDADTSNIFDPRFTTTSSQTGLGLPICKRIIEFYKGKLGFETVVGKGTRFFLSIPCDHEQHP